ncbi:MAG: SMC-Scp complex subunit ScpB [Pedosphaera sp.]|nr:SMC-Scp complex subunit ScpB [Pedosphaera sp.]
MELKHVLEAILFSAQKPMTPAELQSLLATAGEGDANPFSGAKARDIAPALEILAAEHEAAARTYRLICVAGAWQFASQPEFALWIRTLVGQKHRPSRLSKPGLETLAIIAYRQPLTRAEIEEIRGVSIDGVMQTLMERELVEAVGRAEAPGRPPTYGTTKLFLEYFGLRALEDLPDASELRRIPVEKPKAPITTGPDTTTEAHAQVTLEEIIPHSAHAEAATVQTPAPQTP